MGKKIFEKINLPDCMQNEASFSSCKPQPNHFSFSDVSWPFALF